MIVNTVMFAAIEWELKFNREHFSLKAWKPWQLKQLRRFVQ